MDERSQATAMDPSAYTIGPFVGHTRIAYFSMEMALRPEMHTYGGGLGVLAGDTARAAADLELPMIFVTMMSRRGYIRQEIVEGRQVEHPDPWKPEEFAKPLRAKVAVVLDRREVWVRPWLHVFEGVAGHRTPVLLLDTDLDENHDDDRRLTDRLYGGDLEHRFKQEVVLGLGGLRVLQALGFNIAIFHLNEGHAAFLALDLLRRYPRPVDQVHPGEVRFDVVRARGACIFTTHTPVEAGHDRFPYDMYERLLHDYFDTDQLRLLAGRDTLNMTQLALNLSGYVNGVAVKHAETTTRMFPGYDIRAVTNGVHLPTWAHPAFAKLFTEHSRSWAYEPEVMVRFDRIPDAKVWEAHELAKADLVALVRAHCGVELDPALPTIGFARRMTAYKRPSLLFSDLERLKRIAGKFPFQLVLGGKAHPADGPGKQLIADIHGHIATLAPHVRAVFVPNYDLMLAKTIVAGVDVWLNTPEPPLEASGTSGMKAALNGVLNLSVLDGWWLEACIDTVTGWSLEKSGADSASELYDKLENTVLPLYHRSRECWVWMMKQAIGKIPCYFNTHRMMRRYATEAYIARRTTLRTGTRRLR